MSVTYSGDAATTRTSLGLGDAATKTVGTAAGNVPVLDGSGDLSLTGSVVCDGADIQGNILDNAVIKDYKETAQAISGGFTINSSVLNSGNVIHHSGGGTISFDTPSSTYAGVSCTVICQAAPTISGTNVIWSGGEAPTPSGVCVYTFFCGITSGSTYKWFGVEAGLDFA